ncbi:MAG: glycosyltransferase [Bacteroidetes bacterium]|nr:glycosyltransferase [Bacteroidota bacterium]
MTQAFTFTLLFLSLLYALFILWSLAGWCKNRNVTRIKNEFHTKVSVIVPARNEERNIEGCLRDLLKQEYPESLLEIIVVDDHSVDRTSTIARRVMDEFPGRNFSFLQNDSQDGGALYKKQAVTKAVLHAAGELIVTTDADCRMNEKWLAAVVSCYESRHPSMISAPVCFYEEKNVFEKFQSLEFMGLIGIGAGSVSNHHPMMCNGANLAYSRKSFFEVSGFSGADGIPSGDDTQLMMKMAKRDAAGIYFLKSREAIVYTETMHTVTDFMNQRKRWSSKIPSGMSLFVLLNAATAYLLHAGLIACFFFGFYNHTFFRLLFYVAMIKQIPEFLLLAYTAAFFQRMKLLWLFIPAQMIYPFYIAWVGAMAPFGFYAWKGREIKSGRRKIPVS